MIDATALPSDDALDEWLLLLSIAPKIPAVAKAYEDFLNLGEAVVQCDIDTVATKITGQFIVHYHLNDRLQRLLVAVRAGEFQESKCERVESHLGVPVG